MRRMHRGSQFVSTWALSLLFFVTACGADDDRARTSSSTGAGANLDSLTRDLTIGSTGEDVRAVHTYLRNFGYLPNDRLAVDYPAWRPIVPEAPADEMVFDAHSTEAIFALQTHMSLPTTGVVDAATRAILRSPRCGDPEGVARLDPSDKFSLYGSKWGKSTLTYMVYNTDDVPYDDARAAVANALSTWSAETNLFFTEVVAGTADIVIKFVAIDGPGSVAARTGSPADGGDMIIDTAENWSTATPTPSGKLDLQSIVLHELGHAFGLDHSSEGTATMYPSYRGPDHSLSIDDTVAIASIYDKFVQLPGAAKDIAIGPSTSLGGGGGIWIIGINPLGNGFQVYKFNGSDWDADNGGAVRIAVDWNGNPWAVGANGAIYRRTTGTNVGSGTWVRMPGAAHDIAGGSNGSMWIVGTSPVFGGFGMFYWDGTVWVPDSAGGGGVKIAVGPDGVPWITNSANQIFRRTSSDPRMGGWTMLSGSSNDIAINVGNYAWGIGPLSSGPANVALWDEQTSVSSTGNIAGSGAPAVKKWVSGRQVGVGGPNEAVAVDPTGRPWVVDNNGSIFMTATGPWRF